MGYEYVYSALLLNAAGRPVDENGVVSILKAAGVTPNPDQIKTLIESLKGVDINRVIDSVPTPALTQTVVSTVDVKNEADKKDDKKVSEDDASLGLNMLFGG